MQQRATHAKQRFQSEGNGPLRHRFDRTSQSQVGKIVEESFVKQRLTVGPEQTLQISQVVG